MFIDLSILCAFGRKLYFSFFTLFSSVCPQVLPCPWIAFGSEVCVLKFDRGAGQSQARLVISTVSQEYFI